jgi:flagellar hook-length control protein FliK
MLSNVRGRVEMDPMRVPLAASMATGRDDSFEQALQEATAAADEPTAAPAAEAEVDETATAVETPAEAPVAANDEATELPADTSELPSDGATSSTGAGVHAADVTDDIRRGETVRQETAGKGADSPRTSSRTSEPLLAAAMAQRANTPNAAGAGAGNAAERTAAVGGVRSGNAPTRAIAASELRPTAPSRAPAVAASYRTSGTATAEMLEQARDSVFKQILLKLNGDGGEMRLRLQPPDLGELDLRLVVDNGNRLNLTLAADRPELAELLTRHLDELKQSLQQAGLEIGGATVQTRSEFARDQQQRDAAPDSGFAANDDADDPTTPRVRTNWISATGLDFWA